MKAVEAWELYDHCAELWSNAEIFVRKLFAKFCSGNDDPCWFFWDGSLLSNVAHPLLLGIAGCHATWEGLSECVSLRRWMLHSCFTGIERGILVSSVLLSLPVFVDEFVCMRGGLIPTLTPVSARLLRQEKVLATVDESYKQNKV